MNNAFLKENDDFSSLRGLDLQELITYIENYYLDYRDTLGLPNNLTFGVEIEYENYLKTLVDKYIEKEFPYWISKSDGSLRTGGEITSPIMTDNIKLWNELKDICKYLDKNRADTSHNAGGHIHIGQNILGNDVLAWKYFLKLYMAYENVLFRFMYGDKISARKRLNHYAPPVADDLMCFLKPINEAEEFIDIYECLPRDERYYALNFKNIYLNPCMVSKQTLEFRGPNASTNEIIWQNNINTFSKMLISSKEKVMNMDFLDYKLEKEYISYFHDRYMYNEVNLKNALEFVDLVFDNNLDKVYFLRQYIKDFEENYGFEYAVNAKKFVK